jgi:hypothetical protein
MLQADTVRLSLDGDPITAAYLDTVSEELVTLSATPSLD